MTFETILPLVVAPLITAIIGALFSKFGSNSKIKDLELKLKKIELLERLIINSDTSEEKEALKSKISHISNSLIVSEIEDVKFIELSYLKKPWYYRLIFLPRLKTLASRIAGFAYYIYLIYGLILLFWLPKVLWEDHERKELAIIVLISSFLLAFLHRKIAIHFSQRDAIVEKAKIDLYRQSALENE